MKNLLVVLLMLVSISTFAKDTLVIGTMQSVPFVIEDGDRPYGIAFDLLYESLGNNYYYDIIYLDGTSYDGVVNDMVTNNVDILVGDITITPERLEKVEFSQPYFTTNTAIALKNQGGGIFSNLLSGKFMESMLVLLSFILIAGIVMWLIERNHNEGFDKGWYGVFDGSYFVSATMTTVGYGDVAAKTKLGKGVAFILMWVSLGVVGYMYGNISSAITVASLDTEVNLSDLNKMKVATIGGTTSAAFLEENGVKYINYNTPEEALDAINNGELDAFVYDKPILEYNLSDEKYSDIQLVDNNYMEQTYGYVLDRGSEFTDELNTNMMRVIRSEKWELIKNRYNLK